MMLLKLFQFDRRKCMNNIMSGKIIKKVNLRTKKNRINV